MENTKLLFEIFTNKQTEEAHHFAESIKSYCKKNLTYAAFELIVYDLSIDPEISILRNIVILPAVDITENCRTTRIIGSLENTIRIINSCAQRQSCIKMTEDVEKMLKSAKMILKNPK